MDFNNLTGAVQDDVTPAGTANLLDVGGVRVDGTILDFTRTLDGNDYLYEITYAGADYDGDTNNDSLTLKVRVAGLNGGSVVAPNTNNATTGSVVLGTNDVSVNPAFGGADNSFAVNGNNMNAGETLIFSVEDISLSGAAGYGATFDGFNGFEINEGAGTHHRVAIGVGTDLLVQRTTGNLDSSGDFGQTMYLSASDNAFNNANFGIRLIDFNLTVLENFVFDGSTDTDWATGDNWSTGSSPNSAGARVVFDGDNGTRTSADLNGGSFTVGELQVVAPTTATSIQSSSASSVLTLSPSSIGIVMSEATKDFTFDGTTGEAWTLALGGSQTWNVDSTEAAGDLISDSGVTIDLGANTLNTNVGTGREVSIAGEVTGTGGITKSGVGTTILSGTNTYTGATTVSAGTLQVGSTQALGVNPDVQVSNGILKLDGNSITIGGLTGSGTNDGSAAVVNDNASAATLTVGGGDATASFGGVIGDGATGGALSLTKTGTGTQTLSGNNIYTGITTINGGTLQLDGAGTIGTGNTVNDGSLVINGTSDFTYAGDISGTGTLTKSNTGQLTLSGASTYTGATTVNAGTLNATGSFTSAFTVNDGATLLGDGSTTGLLTLGDGSGTGALLDASAGDFTSEGLTTNVGGGNVTVSFSGTGIVDVVTYSSGSGVFTGALSDFTANPALVGGHAGAGTFFDNGTVISMDTGVSANNVWIGTTNGTWEIGGVNSNWDNSSADGVFYDNDFVTFNDTGIAQSTVTLAASVAPAAITFANSSGTYTINDNGGGETITLSSGITSTANGDVTINALVAGTGGISHSGSGNLTIGGNTTLTGDIVNNGSGTLTFGGDITLSNNIVNEGSLVFNQSGTSVSDGQISGSGSLAFSGAGTTTLSGVNTYSGGTTLNSGTLNIGNSDALGAGTITLDSGLLYDAGGTIDLSNDINVTGTAAVQASGGGNLNMSGVISGAGTLNFGGVAPSSSVVITDDLSGFTGTIAFNNVSGANNLTFNSAVSTTAAVSTTGNTGGNRSFSFNGGATIGELSGDGGRLRTSGLLTVNQSADTTYAGSLQDAGSVMSLEKQGTGTLTLTGTNTYTGATTVSGGKLSVTGAGSINGTSGVSIGAGEFNYDSSIAFAETLSFSGTDGILSGNGTFNNAVNVTTGNTLAIGNSVGTMNFVSHLTVTCTYEFELNGGTSSADLGNVGGDLTLGGILDLVQLGSYNVGDKFTLLSYFGTLSGEFTDGSLVTLADDTTFTAAGGIWQINYNDTVAGNNTGELYSNFVTVTAVPEPSAFALLGLGVLGLCARRRR
ncbi:MAG: autotransporter-associated beta strand repeat-containing protein [Akkermansiaceae bacterium]|nr:autotransporter-associated beta strand repeat-containing protein [Akkermansiaceae bacterium]